MPQVTIALEKLQLTCHVHQLKAVTYARKAFIALKEVVRQSHAMPENIVLMKERFYQLELVSQDITAQVDQLQVFQQDQEVIFVL